MDTITPFSELAAALKEDFSVEEDDMFFVSAAILMSSILLGPDPVAIAEYTGFEPETVNPIAQRYQEGGIWTDDGMVCIAWDALFTEDSTDIEKEEATTSFVLDVSVGAGWLSRSILEEEEDGLETED